MDLLQGVPIDSHDFIVVLGISLALFFFSRRKKKSRDKCFDDSFSSDAEEKTSRASSDSTNEESASVETPSDNGENDGMESRIGEQKEAERKVCLQINEETLRTLQCSLQATGENALQTHEQMLANLQKMNEIVQSMNEGDDGSLKRGAALTTTETRIRCLERELKESKDYSISVTQERDSAMAALHAQTNETRRLYRLIHDGEEERSDMERAAASLAEKYAKLVLARGNKGALCDQLMDDLDEVRAERDSLLEELMQLKQSIQEGRSDGLLDYSNELLSPRLEMSVFQSAKTTTSNESLSMDEDEFQDSIQDYVYENIHAANTDNTAATYDGIEVTEDREYNYSEVDTTSSSTAIQHAYPWLRYWSYDADHPFFYNTNTEVSSWESPEDCNGVWCTVTSRVVYSTWEGLQQWYPSQTTQTHPSSSNEDIETDSKTNTVDIQPLDTDTADIAEATGLETPPPTLSPAHVRKRNGFIPNTEYQGSTNSLAAAWGGGVEVKDEKDNSQNHSESHSMHDVAIST